MTEKNEAILRGTIINMSISGKLGIIRLAVEGSHGVKNYPTVVFYDIEALKEISIHQRVIIYGHTQNRRVRKQNTTDAWATITQVIGDRIEPAQRMLLDFYSTELVPDEKGGVPDDINKVLWAGQVLEVYIPNLQNDMAILRVGNNQGEYHRQCNFTCFERQGRIAKKLQKNDEIVLVGKITTTIKENQGEREHFQNIVCQDLYSKDLAMRKKVSTV